MSKTFKFFRPINADKHKPQLNSKVVGATATLLTLSMLVTLLTFNHTPVTMNLKADPVVWDSIVKGKDTYATIVYKNDISFEGLNVFKSWQFGDLKIVYTYATSDALKKLVKQDNVIRISGWGKIGLPPYSYVVNSEGITYDFSEDYKIIYHKANQRWLGDGVTIAVIDTGIDYLHQDFYVNDKTIIKALVSTIYLNSNGKPLVVEKFIQKDKCKRF